MTRPVDHHGFPCSERFLPLDPEPWKLTVEEAIARRRTRGDVVSNSPRINWLSEVMRGYQFQPANVRAEIDARVKGSDPLAQAQREVDDLRQQLRAAQKLQGAPTWPLWRHPVADPPELRAEDAWGPKTSGWVLVKTAHGRMYTAELRDWAIDEDDEPSLIWTMAGRDGYSINDVTGWMPLPPEEPAPLPAISRSTTVINVNRQVIDRNTKHQTNAPPIRIQKGKSGKPTYTHAAAILDKSGEEVGRFIYNAQGSLVACGARLVMIAHFGAVPVSECVDTPTDAG